MVAVDVVAAAAAAVKVYNKSRELRRRSGEEGKGSALLLNQQEPIDNH